jgi:hypothetical protein
MFNVTCPACGYSPSRTGLTAQAPKRSPRFSCMLFRGVHGVFHYAGPGHDLRSNAMRRCCLPADRKGSASGSLFSEFNTQPTAASVYASPATSRRPVQDSRSRWTRFAFPAELFHPLQHAGLSRRSLSPFCPGPETPGQDLPRRPPGLSSLNRRATRCFLHRMQQTRHLDRTTWKNN